MDFEIGERKEFLLWRVWKSLLVIFDCLKGDLGRDNGEFGFGLGLRLFWFLNFVKTFFGILSEMLLRSASDSLFVKLDPIELSLFKKKIHSLT